jgi:hypothetical protein
LNKKGYSLIEVMIVSVIGLFILEAAYLLYTGSLKTFKDVKARSDNVQTQVPSMELIARYFDRWGVNVITAGADCSAYPPSNAKCITVTAGSPCDDVTFWGNIYGDGFVAAVASGTATLVSCRLSSTGAQSCYYLWRDDALQNDTIAGVDVPLSLNNNLNPNNADCSSLTAASPTNATVSATMVPLGAHVGATNKTMAAGDMIQRAPHRVRLYCAANASDGGQNWLYVDLTDTATDCNSDENASPIAPVNSFQVQLLPTGCNATNGGCTAANMTVVLRSQSRKYSRAFDVMTAQRVFGR